MGRITRADLRGKPLIKYVCYDATISHHECGPQDNRQYCYGIIDKRNDELIPECAKCKAHVNYVTSLKEEK